MDTSSCIDAVESRERYIRELKIKNNNLEKELEVISTEFNDLVEERDAIEHAYDEMCDYAGKLEDELDLYEEPCQASEDTDCDSCTDDCRNECCEACVNDIEEACWDRLFSNFEVIPLIRNIYYCDKPGKEKTIVIFADGTKVIKEPVSGDIFDLNVGVALCIAEKMFGSKSKFHKVVKKIAGIREHRNKIVKD